MKKSHSFQRESTDEILFGRERKCCQQSPHRDFHNLHKSLSKLLAMGLNVLSNPYNQTDNQFGLIRDVRDVRIQMPNEPFQISPSISPWNRFGLLAVDAACWNLETPSVVVTSLRSQIFRAVWIVDGLLLLTRWHRDCNLTVRFVNRRSDILWDDIW